MSDDPCVKKQDCKICQAFMPAQLKQLSTPTYLSRKERELKKSSSDSPASATPTLDDPADVSVLGRVHKESKGSSPASKKKRADPSPTPKASSKKKSSSSKSRSDDIKDLDEKWSECFVRLEAMLVSKTFTVPVNPVQNPPSVVTSDRPFFYPGASTTGLFAGVTVGGTGSSLDQTTSEAAVMREAVNKSATRPVEGPGTDVKQQNATQPVEAPGAGMATQPVEAPGAGPEFLLTGTGSAALYVEFTGSDSEEEFQSEPGSPVDGNVRDSSPDLTRDESADQELSEESAYRETIRGVRSFMGWHQIPEFDIVSSTDDNPFAGSRVKPTGKVSVKLPVEDWLCRKMEKLNLIVAEGYPSKSTQTAGLLRDQFVKTPRSSRWYDMQADKKDSDSSAVHSSSPEPAKLNNAFSTVARRNLPTAPHSRVFTQDILRRWERAAREQSIVCNQAAGLSRLTKVQDEMFTQLKNLHSVKGKGKSSERTQQTVDKLEY